MSFFLLTKIHVLSLKNLMSEMIKSRMAVDENSIYKLYMLMDFSVLDFDK